MFMFPRVKNKHYRPLYNKQAQLIPNPFVLAPVPAFKGKSENKNELPKIEQPMPTVRR